MFEAYTRISRGWVSSFVPSRPTAQHWRRRFPGISRARGLRRGRDRVLHYGRLRLQHETAATVAPPDRVQPPPTPREGGRRPKAHTIAELTAFLGIEARQCVKTLMVDAARRVVALVLRATMSSTR